MARVETATKKGRKSKTTEKEIEEVKSFKNVSKGDLWDYQETTVINMLKKSEKDAEFVELWSHYQAMIKSSFMVEKYNLDDKLSQKSLEKQGYKLGEYKLDDKVYGIALKKKTIKKITDFTYENIRHITAAKMLDVIANNFGGGWESISQSIRDIIESGFDISTTTLPSDRLHKEGGMYEKKVADGFDVLEIPKGTWTEAIFAKVKPIIEIPHMNLFDTSDKPEGEDNEESADDYNRDIDMNNDEVDDMNEDNYRTTFDIPGVGEDEDLELNDGLDDDE